MYKVLEIIEPDFGCEGIPDGQEPECEVVLQDENGEKLKIKIADRILYDQMIVEGINVEYTNGKLLKL